LYLKDLENTVTLRDVANEIQKFIRKFRNDKGGYIGPRKEKSIPY